MNNLKTLTHSSAPGNLDIQSQLPIPSRQEFSAPPELYARKVWVPAVDISEDLDCYRMAVDLAGVSNTDACVQVFNCIISVFGRRDPAPRVVQTRQIQNERPSGYFARSFILPKNANEHAIRLEYEQGVLLISIPKLKALKSVPIRKGEIHKIGV
jgi:HSP20 family molecular chaperone IbpA